MRLLTWFSSCFILLVLWTSNSNAIGIRIDATSGGTLQDAILVGSVAGAAPRDTVVLGDLDLAETDFVFDVTVNPAVTHWWLIAHQGADVVYSSVLDLVGMDLHDVEPYDIPGAELAWDIPANLDGLVNGTGHSLDWWAQTVNNHASHVAPDGGSAGLWKFASPGTSVGSVAVNLHNNVVPNGNPPGSVPESASTLILLLIGTGGLGFLNRRLAGLHA